MPALFCSWSNFQWCLIYPVSCALPPSGAATHRYVFMLDSLPAKCRKAWKYVPAAMAVAQAIFSPAAAADASGPGGSARPVDGAAAPPSTVTDPRALETCTQCLGPVWRAGGVHLHVTEEPFRDVAADE